jgi:UDP-N-acetylmuramate dehydrogenase
MMAVAKTTSNAALRGTLHANESLARHTAWAIGGCADRFYEPADLDDLCAFVATLAADEPLFFLGLGSNLLVRDGGIRGTVVHLANALSGIARSGANTVRAEAGVACPKVARFCAREDLAGAEFMAGIPGTVGGALAMNAGAFGGETYGIVFEVETITRDGTRYRHQSQDLHPGYRHVDVPQGHWFVAAHLLLQHGVRGDSEARIRELLRQRAQTQPTGTRSCGSVFRNPPNDHAARLIEQCGLKGQRVGDAQVSTKHANFIINTGKARAADVEALIAHIMMRVQENFGVQLIPEVRVVGEAS